MNALLNDIEPPSPKNDEDQNHKKNIFSDKLSQTLQSIIGIATAAVRLIHAFCKKAIFSIVLSLKKARDFMISGRYMPHAVVCILLILVLISNFAAKVQAQSLEGKLISVDPSSEQQIIAVMDNYTTVINNGAEIFNKSNIALQIEGGFISNTASVDTKITQRTEPLPDNTNNTVYYVIRTGDTLTALSWNFEVKVASLQYVNNLTNLDMIKPGTRIKIPPKGYAPTASQILAQANANKPKAVASSKTAKSTDKKTYGGTYDTGGNINLIVPVSSQGISQGFGAHGHTGIDYRASTGTSVKAAADGVVILVSTGWSGGYGNQIVISHGNGIATRYGHLSQINVSPGQTVSQGQTIGSSGSTGRSTGPHLHFEKIVNGRVVKPF